MPSTAARVQANIGAKKAFAYDLIAACSGFVLHFRQLKNLYLQVFIRRGWLLEVKPYQRL